MDDKNNVIAFKAKDVLKQTEIGYVHANWYDFDSLDDPEYLRGVGRLPSDLCKCCGEGWRHLLVGLEDGVWSHIFTNKCYKVTRWFTKVPTTEGWAPSLNKGEK